MLLEREQECRELERLLAGVRGARRVPGQHPEQNMALLRRMWSGRPEDAGHLSAVLRVMRAQSMEFSEAER